MFVAIWYYFFISFSLTLRKTDKIRRLHLYFDSTINKPVSVSLLLSIKGDDCQFFVAISIFRIFLSIYRHDIWHLTSRKTRKRKQTKLRISLLTHACLGYPSYFSVNLISVMLLTKSQNIQNKNILGNNQLKISLLIIVLFKTLMSIVQSST